MAKERLAVAEMIMNIILGKTEGVSKVDFLPQKREFPFGEAYEQPFERATPESQGISSKHLEELVRELAESEYTDMHHFLALRHGKVICECNFAPYRSGIWHITHSMCKTITGMAIGMLVEEGQLSLDENIYRIFESRVNPLRKILRPEVTVKHLLTMTSAVSFNESGAVSGNDWLSGFLNAAVTEKPGSTFQYNSMNSYVLSAIVTERTGLRLDEYLRPRLFEPMGITKYFWETCPRGITKGGWGLFLCPEDMAKLGELYLRKGCWKGKQLVPEHWVTESTQKHMETGGDTRGYGYQLWMEGRPGSFEFNGMLGQNVVVYPDMDMVLVTCAGNNELFQDCVMLNIIRKYFPESYQPAERLPENRAARGELGRLCRELESGTPGMTACTGGWQGRSVKETGSRKLPGSPRSLRENRRSAGGRRRAGGGMIPGITGAMRKLSGRTYDLDRKSIGIFPLVMQVFHNNLTRGISRVSFQCEKEAFYVLFQEGEEWLKLQVGFGRAKETQLTVRQETYLVGTTGAFAMDENGRLVLKLDLAYMEEAVRRKIFFYFEKDRVEVRWFETPGKRMIMDGLESISAELENNVLFAPFRGNGALEVIHRLMGEAIEPVARGILEQAGAENTDAGNTDAGNTEAEDVEAEEVGRNAADFEDTEPNAADLQDTEADLKTGREW